MVAVKSKDQWTALKKRCTDEKKFLLVDFFAHWCPPCRRAAPLYAKMSSEWDSDAVVFAKIDGSSLRVEKGVRAFPTFVFYDQSGSKMKKFEGFDPVAIKACLASNGIKKVKPESKKGT